MKRGPNCWVLGAHGDCTKMIIIIIISHASRVWRVSWTIQFMWTPSVTILSFFFYSIFFYFLIILKIFLQLLLNYETNFLIFYFPTYFWELPFISFNSWQLYYICNFEFVHFYKLWNPLFHIFYVSCAYVYWCGW